MRRGTSSAGCIFRTTAVLLVVSVGVVTGCVGTASRVHLADEPITDIRVSDVDLRAMARKMASAIIELPVITKASSPVSISFLKIENRTMDPSFNSYNLLGKIRQDLIKHSRGKIVFLDKKQMDEIYAERDKKRAGTVTSTKREKLPGVDYFLTGHAYEMHKAGPDGRMLGYHRYSFRLTDAETSVVVWEDDYEFKKHGRRGIVYR